jgi:hypothetical protein
LREEIMGRKFWLAIIYESALMVVLGAVLLAEKLTDVIFAAWLAAFTAGFVTYVMGNIAAKNVGAPPDPKP